ncbi:hypothetical protein B0H13DRAFT_2690100 [Mycena leptocephala]|nr:hypothetical protein B0H13DRAFT_2690100 [Mycena leptocephala]
MVNAALLCCSLCLRVCSRRRLRFIPSGRFNFFGGCGLTQPRYTPLEILLGRSLSRPLVRGESRGIRVIRAILLVWLGLAIPVVGGYVMLVVPIQARVMTRDIAVSQDWFSQDPGPYYDQNITIVFAFIVFGGTLTDLAITAGDEICPYSSLTDAFTELTAVCPFSWLDPIHIIVAANFTGTDGILYVKPGQGDPSDVSTYTEAIPLIPGSHLSVVLSITQREIFSKNALDLLGFTTPLKSIFLTSVLLSQADPFPPNSGSDSVSLRLRMRNDIYGPIKIVQDYTDASVLNGFATFGGFWTFVNGTSALLFGGNLLYFLFRRRPLSPLGLVHIFQRRGLMRNWNEDFPTLRTEGGRPGSPSAGIVAFIRERLVDLDDDDAQPEDLEAQNTSLQTAYHSLAIGEAENGHENDTNSATTDVQTTQTAGDPPDGVGKAVGEAGHEHEDDVKRAPEDGQTALIDCHLDGVRDWTSDSDTVSLQDRDGSRMNAIPLRSVHRSATF